MVAVGSGEGAEGSLRLCTWLLELVEYEPMFIQPQDEGDRIAACAVRGGGSATETAEDVLTEDESGPGDWE